MIRVVLPGHLRALLRVPAEIELDVAPPITQRSVLDALEARFPALRGAIRDQTTLVRRPFIRFFACQRDLSHEHADAPLPAAVVAGAEPYIILGAIAGGNS
jgi:molybdopterin converting factor small subunit